MVSLAFKRWHLPFLLQDAKKSVWVPDGEGGYDEAMIDNIDGEKVNFRTFWTFLFEGQCPSWLGGKDLQGEPADASEPPEDGEVWGRFQHDLPQRGFCALESQVEIRLQVDLCKFVIWNCKTK